MKIHVMHAVYRGPLDIRNKRYRSGIDFSLASLTTDKAQSHKAAPQKYGRRFIFRSVMSKTEVTVAMENSLRQEQEETWRGSRFPGVNYSFLGH